MQLGRFYRPVILAFCLLISLGAIATDFKGKYRTTNTVLELAPGNNDSYTGTFNIKDKSYPVVATEKNGTLEGYFTANETKFNFTAELSDGKLSLLSDGRTVVLTRDKTKVANPLDDVAPEVKPKPHNPFDDVAPNPNPNPTPPLPAPQPQPTPPTANNFITGDDAINALQNIKAGPQNPDREWLVVVYLDCDHNLFPFADPILKSMEKGLPEEGVDVLVLMDRPIYKTDKGEEKRPHLYRVKRSVNEDRIDSEVLLDFGPINVADPRVLSAFIAGSLKAFPAKQHALFTWDHGGTWQALTYDDHPGKKNTTENMTMPIFRKSVMDGMKAAGLAKWDLLSFDMCLMGQLEVAAEVHDLTDVMIASEALEPAPGQPYTAILQAMGKGTMGGRRIGSTVVQEFDKYHKTNQVRSTTLSAMDMALYDEVNAKLNAVCEKLIPAMATDWTPLARSYFYAEQYHDSRDEFRRGKAAHQSIDLMDALKKCRGSMTNFPAEAEFKELRSVMDRFVIANANSDRRKMSNGVAIYAPVVQSAYDPDYEKLQFYKTSKWPSLLKALYPEQAKNKTIPKFNKIELVNKEGKPESQLLPMKGYNLDIEVDGKGIVWIRDLPAVRDEKNKGMRVLAASYIVDADFVTKMQKIDPNKLSQDVDLLMPEFKDGINKVTHPLWGLRFMANTGDKSHEVMIDASDLQDPATFIVPVRIADPKTGNKPRRANLYCDMVDMGVKRIQYIEQTADGHFISNVTFDPPSPEATITALFLLIGDDSTEKLVDGDTFLWNKGLRLTIDNLPPGDYEEILVAETLTGVRSIGRCKMPVGNDVQLAQSKTSFRDFRYETMLGTWEWQTLANPPGVLGQMTLTPCKFKNVYSMLLTTVDGKGKTNNIEGFMAFEISDLPHYRMIMSAPGVGVAAIPGTMTWLAQNGPPRILSHNLALNTDILWVKTKNGNPGPNPTPGPNPNPNPNPGPGPVVQQTDGIVITDANQTISILIPTSFTKDDEVVAHRKKVWPGFDYAAYDQSVSAAVDIIRFDGIRDANEVIRLRVDGAATYGARIQLNAPTSFVVEGVQIINYSGQANNNGNLLNVSINLIPTASGYVCIDLMCSARNPEVAIPILFKVASSIQLLKTAAANGANPRTSTRSATDLDLRGRNGLVLPGKSEDK